MKIGLIGYGKMGKAIEKIALERGHEIAFRVNSSCPIDQIQISDADVCIEFTQPKLAIGHINTLIDHRIPSVIGTTGWNEYLEEVKNRVQKTDGSLIHASNFSIGVNLFFQLNEYLSSLMAPYSDYHAEVEEIHHTQKLDYPSGTAITLTEGIIAHHPEYTKWNTALNEEPEKQEHFIPVKAVREEDVPGTHSITYSNEIDSIRIEHIAKNRTGFALGAVIAAEWIVNKKGIYTFRDILKSKL